MNLNALLQAKTDEERQANSTCKCGKCGKLGEPDHHCPYKLEVENDPEQCNCCGTCEDACLNEI